MKRSLTISFALFLVLSVALTQGSEETFTFEADNSRLMGIIINSLYSEKEIFLRELISNSSDALDKIRYISLTEPSALGTGDDANLEIIITWDDEAHTMTIRDRGVGMTKQELITNLGTIAKSGTKAFLENMEAADSNNLIGQFGVGFYSAFLVADRVTVRSKSNNDPDQWIWSSTASEQFTITKDEDGESLGRGTEITLHLKEEAEEYHGQERLKTIIEKYSEFINYPIKLWWRNSEWVEEEVEDDEPEAGDVAPSDAGDEAEAPEPTPEDDNELKVEELPEDEGEDGAEEKPKKTQRVEKVDYEWKLINSNKPIWLRSKSDITEEEYNSFYKSMTRDTIDPLTYTHFSAEGEHEFRSILFIPGKAPWDLFAGLQDPSPGLKLYVRRVFITDDFEDMLPKYLGFVKGVIDSNDIPINVSREMLQEHRSLRVIKKKVVRKVLEMIKNLALDPEKEEQWDTFWKNYGTNIKLGVMDDFSNKNKLVKLLRFYTSASETLGKDSTTLEDYVSRMPEDQKHIYYLGGESREAVANAPALERLYEKGYEVLFLTEPIDEYVAQALVDFDGHKFMNAAKEDLQLGGDDDEVDEDAEAALNTKFSPLTDYLAIHLGPKKVSKVTLSRRLGSSPATLVTAASGFTANMERIMKAQAMVDPNRAVAGAVKTLELNPRHPLVIELNSRISAAAPGQGEEEAPTVDATTTAMAQLLYDSALLTSGFSIDDPKDFSTKIHELIAVSLGVDPSAPLAPPIDLRPKKSDDEEPVDDGSVTVEGVRTTAEPILNDDELEAKDEL